MNALAGPTFEWPGREFHLLSASLALFAEPDWLDTASVDVWPAAGHTPQMLWPEDRSWVLATEIDWDFTIIAGSFGPTTMCSKTLVSRRSPSSIVMT